MEIQVVEMKRCALVKASGRLDGAVSPQFSSALKALTNEGKYKIVLNLADAPEITSACLRELMGAWKTCRRYNRGDLRLSEVSPKIAQVLNLTGIGTQFSTYETDAEAVGSF